MTREEILNIQPGRELDALVEREIIFRDSKDDPDAQHVFKTAHLWCKSYSTDISAAWEVVEKFTDMEIGKSGSDYVASMDHPGFYVQAKSAPEAICKAALLAMLEV